MNLFKFYPKEWMDNRESPIVHVIYADRIQDFAEHVFGRVLTETELKWLPHIFEKIWDFGFLEEAIGEAIGRPREVPKYVDLESLDRSSIVASPASNGEKQ